jgi:hypothetical protein
MESFFLPDEGLTAAKNTKKNAIYFAVLEIREINILYFVAI